MKKRAFRFVESISMLSVLVFVAIGLTGCFFNNASGTNTNEKIKYSVEIVYEDETVPYEFSGSNNINITPRYKSGMVLEGFYTEPSGEGVKYLDYLGKSISNDWKQSETNRLYPYYTEIDYTKEFKSSIIRDEEPYSFTYNVHGTAMWCGWGIDFDQESSALTYFYKASLCNPDINIMLIGYGDLMGTREGACDMRLSIATANSNDGYEAGVIQTNTFTVTKQYVTEETSKTITGSVFSKIKGKRIGVGFFMKSPYLSDSHYFKNVYYSLKFVKPVESEEEE